MYSNAKTLAQDVKREVVNELREGNYAHYPQFNRYSGNDYGPRGYWGDYPPYVINPTYQTVKDNVKDEVLAQIQMEQAEHMARRYGFDRALSDRRIQQMVDSHYRSIGDMKADILKDLLAVKGVEAVRTKDPYIRQITNDIIREAKYQGIPLQQVTQHLGQQSRPGSGIFPQIMEVINKGQRRGLLCGIGMALLGHHLFSRGKLRSVAVRSLEEGMSVVDRAKSFVGGQWAPPSQPPQTDFSPPSPEPSPPTGDQPPGGDNIIQ